MSYTGIGGLGAALGQLGGAWGWYSIWLAFPNQAPVFKGWFYTDHGTARFIAQQARGPGAGYTVAGAGGSGSAVYTSGFSWKEIVRATSSWHTPPHVSWFYAHGSLVSAIETALLGSDYGFQSKYSVRDAQNRAVT